jgi:tRNA 2-thiouridine synthesizing protein A
VKPPLVVDARGLFCPKPVIKTSEAIQTIEPGDLLEVVADDPAIVIDLPAWCASNGHAIRRREVREKTYRFFVEKAGAASDNRGTLVPDQSVGTGGEEPGKTDP